MKQSFYVTFGAIFGFGVSFLIFLPISKRSLMPKIDLKKNEILLYDESLSQKLFNEVRLLCWVMTSPEFHYGRAIYIKRTWGKRCNKLLFMSSTKDVNLGTIALPVGEGRDNLWDKTKRAFEFIYRNHFEEFDWFVKADDDSYLIPENIRFLLSRYQPEMAIYMGGRFVTSYLPEGYMAGGAYILSKGALRKLVTKLLQNETICSWRNEGSEDAELGACLAHSAIFGDERDENLQKRFFPVGVKYHFEKLEDLTWFEEYQYFRVPEGNLSCCSDTPAAFHYIEPAEMYGLEYLILNVHPFGLQKNFTEKLPTKLKLSEIIKAADAESPSINYQKHEIYHNTDETEIYR